MKKLLLILLLPVVLAFGLSMHGLSVKPILLKYSPNENMVVQDAEMLYNQLSSYFSDNELEKAELIVINRWATWCGPCIQEIPELNELVAEFEESGVLFIAISDESLETVEEWFEGRPDFNFDYTLVSGDPELVKLLDAFDEENGGTSIPYHLIFSTDWELINSWTGASPLNIMAIENTIAKQLSNTE
jgi:thiol-disulfide isomerase/thioredoxin